MDLNGALKEIVSRKGKSILADADLLKAHLSDLAPNLSGEISVLYQASLTHIFDDLSRCEEKETEACLKVALLKISELYSSSYSERIKEALIYALEVNPYQNTVKQEKKMISSPAVMKSTLENTDSEPAAINIQSTVNHGNSLRITKWIPAAFLTANVLFGVLSIISIFSYYSYTGISVKTSTWILFAIDLLGIVLIILEKHILALLLFMIDVMLPAVRSIIEGNLTVMSVVMHCSNLAAIVYLLLLPYRKTDKWYLPAVISIVSVAAAIVNEYRVYGSLYSFSIIQLISNILYVGFLWFYGKYLYDSVPLFQMKN